MYRLGVVPWEHRDLDQVWPPILARLPGPGRALDIGCGSGRDAVYLAKQGWQVTAIDFVDKALDRARQRAREEGVEVRWIRADVGELARLGLEPGQNLIYDYGCLHGLPDDARQGLAAGINQLAAPGAILLIFAAGAGRRLFLPRGINQDELAALLGEGWTLEARRSVAEEMTGPMRRADPTVYSFRRQGEQL